MVGNQRNELPLILLRKLGVLHPSTVIAKWMNYALEPEPLPFLLFSKDMATFYTGGRSIRQWYTAGPL